MFIDAGQIRMTAPNGLSGSLVWLNTPNGLDLNGQNPSIGGLGGSGSLSLVGSSLTIDGSHDGLHLGVISRTGAIKINMTGSQAFGSSNTYSGGTELFTGTIVVDSEGDLGDTSGALAFGDGTFHATATHTQTRDMLFAVIGANGTIDVDNGRTLTWAGTITEPTGGPTLNKTGSGTLALTNNANFYGGKLVIDQGLVSTTSGGLNATAITLNTNDALLFADASTSLGSLYGSGSLDVPGGKSVSIGNDGRDFAYAGDIGGSGALSKAGIGTFTYSGACSLGTGITLDAGTLELDGDLVTPIFTNLDGDSSTTLRGQGLIQSALVHDGSIAPDTPGGSRPHHRALRHPRRHLRLDQRAPLRLQHRLRLRRRHLDAEHRDRRGQHRSHRQHHHHRTGLHQRRQHHLRHQLQRTGDGPGGRHRLLHHRHHRGHDGHRGHRDREFRRRRPLHPHPPQPLR